MRAPPRPCDRPGGLADEGAVDVDDSRDRQPAREPAARLVPPNIRLTPVQEAWSDYVTHSLYRCNTCRAADGTACDTAEDLYRAFRHLAITGMDEVWRG